MLLKRVIHVLHSPWATLLMFVLLDLENWIWTIHSLMLSFHDYVLGMTLDCLHRVTYLSHPGAIALSC